MPPPFGFPPEGFDFRKYIGPRPGWTSVLPFLHYWALAEQAKSREEYAVDTQAVSSQQHIDRKKSIDYVESRAEKSHCGENPSLCFAENRAALAHNIRDQIS